MLYLQAQMGQMPLPPPPQQQLQQPQMPYPQQQQQQPPPPFASYALPMLPPPSVPQYSSMPPSSLARAHYPSGPVLCSLFAATICMQPQSP